MLTSTFVLLQGIGPATERRLWQEGVLDWQRFLQRPRVSGLSPERKTWCDRELAAAQSAFEARSWNYFASRLKSRDHWRFYDHCRSRILYLDIETTGGGPEDGEITVVGIHRNGQTTCLIRGENLTTNRLQEELDQSELLVTFFGTGFDIPFLRAKFPQLTFAIPHFDLCVAARRLGLRGGLKHIERAVGIERDAALHGLDGWDAVRLWGRWCNGDRDALDLLLAYNTADTRNLEPLADHVYAELLSRYGPASVRCDAAGAPVCVDDVQ
jgi:hypothetical protein